MKDETCGRKVLIIDDSWDVPNLVKLIIGRFHPADIVTVMSSASQGLMSAEQDPPDLVIVRLMMAEMTGAEACKRLKSMPTLQNIPVLLEGAKAPAGVYPVAKQVGAAGYIEEPFSPQGFMAAYDVALQGQDYYPPLPDTPDSS